MADSSFFSSAFSSAKNLNPFKQNSEKDIDPENTTNTSSTSDNIKDSVQNASAAISDVFTDAKDAVVDGANAAAEKVSEIASDVKEAVVGNKSDDHVEAVEGTVVEAHDTKVVEESKNSELVDKAEEAVSNAKDAVSAALSDTKHKIEEIVAQAKDTVVGEAHKVDDEAANVVEEHIEVKTVAVDGAAAPAVESEEVKVVEGTPVVENVADAHDAAPAPAPAATESEEVKVVEGTPIVEDVTEDLKKDQAEQSGTEPNLNVVSSEGLEAVKNAVAETAADVKDAIVESADYVGQVTSGVVVDEAAEPQDVKDTDSTVVLVNGVTATGEPILGTVTVSNEPQTTSEGEAAHAEPEAAKVEQQEETIVPVHVNPSESAPEALAAPELVAHQESTEAHQGSVEGSAVVEPDTQISTDPVADVSEPVAESAAAQEETISAVHVESTESAPAPASDAPAADAPAADASESAPAPEYISLEDHATPVESEIHQHVLADEQIASHPAQEFIPVGEHEPTAAFSEHTDAHPDVTIPEVAAPTEASGEAPAAAPADAPTEGEFAQEATEVVKPSEESVEEPVIPVHVTATESAPESAPAEVNQQDVVASPEGDSAQISGAAQDFIPLDGHAPVADSAPEKEAEAPHHDNDNVEESFTEVHVVSTESAPEPSESHPESHAESHPTEEAAATEPLAFQKPTEVSVPEVVPAAVGDSAPDAVDFQKPTDASVPEVSEAAPSGSVEEPIEAVHVNASESAPAAEPAPESSDPVEESFEVAHHQVAESAPLHEDQQPESARSIESYLNESTPESNDESFEKIDHPQVEATPSDVTLQEHAVLSDPVEKVVVATVAAIAVGGAAGAAVASGQEGSETSEAHQDVQEEPIQQVIQAPQETQSSQKPKATTLAELRMSHETAFPVPYRSKLVEPFEPGQTLIVKGKTGEDSIRFTVNLHSHTADFSGNDVPLHISVRFDEGKLVFNTFSKGEWGKEERKSNPYKKGDDIDIRIRAHDSKFQIFVDQKEVKEYEHRVPLSSITHFTIDGDVLVNYIHWGGKYYPVPYESGLAGEGLAPGKTLTIFGIPEKKAKRFHINLLKKNGDIALHLNSRFDEKHVVRNSLISNAWGNEEREGKLPFEKAVGFDLEIHNEPYALSINVNGERFASYAHRLSPDDINGLQIGGDVEITGIQIA